METRGTQSQVGSDARRMVSIGSGIRQTEFIGIRDRASCLKPRTASGYLPSTRDKDEAIAA